VFPRRGSNSTFVPLSENKVTREDIDSIVHKVGEFDRDNRAGIEQTLHRISAIRNRHNDVVGLTCRVGRALYGKIEIIEDLVKSGASILILGRPGIGKRLFCERPHGISAIHCESALYRGHEQ